MTTKIAETALKLLGHVHDEHEFMDLCRQHGIISLVYRALKKGGELDAKLSTAIKEEFEKIYYGVAMSNLRRQEELRLILNACAAKNLEFIVLKGMALAYYVYRDVALRPMGDIDLFVRKEDVSKMEQILLELGYAHFDQEKQALLKELSCGLQFSREGRFSLEINWDIVQLERIKGSVRFNNEDLWKYVFIYDAGPLSFKILKPEMQILTLGFHHFLHGFIRLIWLNDIAAMIQVHGTQMDWELIVNLAGHYKIKHLIWFVLNLSQSLLGAAVPSWVLKKFEPAVWKRSLYRQLIAEKEILYHPRTRLSSKRYLADILLMDGLFNESKVVKNIIFPSKAWITNHYNLMGKNTAGLYRIAHPFILLTDSVKHKSK